MFEVWEHGTKVPAASNDLYAFRRHSPIAINGVIVQCFSVHEERLVSVPAPLRDNYIPGDDLEAHIAIVSRNT